MSVTLFFTFLHMFLNYFKVLKRFHLRCTFRKLLKAFVEH
jgi:hypothetical protein